MSWTVTEVPEEGESMSPDFAEVDSSKSRMTGRRWEDLVDLKSVEEPFVVGALFSAE